MGSLGLKEASFPLKTNKKHLGFKPRCFFVKIKLLLF